MSEDSLRSIMSWQERRAHAQTRPAMYIGSQKNGHKSAISDVLRLVWQAKVFRRPQAVTIDLSPTQYVVRAECGPLIRPVQQMFTFGDGRTLSGSWQEEGKAYFSRIVQQDEQRGLAFSQQRNRRGWRYCFSGPTGPRLASLSYPFILAHHGTWGIRTNEGLWCEAYQEGVPVGRPFLLSNPSPIGLLSAAALDPQWFTGLPFTQEDAQLLAGMSHSHFVGQKMYGPHPNYTRGEIVTRWHPQDNLITDRILTADGLRGYLADSARG